MPSNNQNLTPSDHRARIAAEAVVSAYIHELAQPTGPRRRGDVHADLVAAAPALVSTPPRARQFSRARGGAIAPRRRRMFELAT